MAKQKVYILADNIIIIAPRIRPTFERPGSWRPPLQVDQASRPGAGYTSPKTAPGLEPLVTRPLKHKRGKFKNTPKPANDGMGRLTPNKVLEVVKVIGSRYPLAVFGLALAETLRRMAAQIDWERSFPEQGVRIGEKSPTDFVEDPDAEYLGEAGHTRRQQEKYQEELEEGRRRTRAAFKKLKERQGNMVEEVLVTAPRLKRRSILELDFKYDFSYALPEPAPEPDPLPDLEPAPKPEEEPVVDPEDLPEPANDPEYEPEPERRPGIRPWEEPDQLPDIWIPHEPITVPERKDEPIEDPEEEPEIPPNAPEVNPEEAPEIEPSPEEAPAPEVSPDPWPDDYPWSLPGQPFRHPDLAPDQLPHQEPEPETEPRPRPRPRPKEFHGAMELSVGPNLNLMLRIYKPRTRYRQEHKRRKDTKQKNQALYNAGLRLINRTYGELDEALDIKEILEQNISLDGTTMQQMSLQQKRELLEALSEGEISLQDLEVDWQQIVIDLWVNEATDRAIALSGELYKEGMQGMDILSR